MITTIAPLQQQRHICCLNALMDKSTLCSEYSKTSQPYLWSHIFVSLNAYRVALLYTRMTLLSKSLFQRTTSISRLCLLYNLATLVGWGCDMESFLHLLLTVSSITNEVLIFGGSRWRWIFPDPRIFICLRGNLSLITDD